MKAVHISFGYMREGKLSKLHHVLNLTSLLLSMSVERDIRFDLIARLCPNTTGAELRSVATEVRELDHS
jgi:ATP-dependent 26S proteasome regulatory subunit